MIDLTGIISAVLTLIVALITRYFVPYLKNMVNTQRLDEFHKWVDILVAAAEQTYKSDESKAKKMYVVNRLNELGYTIYEDDVDDAIEAAVLKLHNSLSKEGTT